MASMPVGNLSYLFTYALEETNVVFQLGLE